MITRFADQVKIRLTSQLIEGISRILQKLLKYFNETIISTLSILSLLSVLPVNFALKLNGSVVLAPLNSKKFSLSFTVCKFLQYCFQMVLNSYHYFLLNYILALLYKYLYHYLFAYYIFHLRN